MNRLAFLLLVLALTGCSSLPGDPASRRQVYEQRLRRLELPVTRARLYKALRPESPARPTGDPGASLLSGSEFYRLDNDFGVEMSVVYKAVVGAEDYLNPAPTLRGQIRSILDATQSIDNFVNRGTPEHPDDIVRKARIVMRPSYRSASF